MFCFKDFSKLIKDIFLFIELIAVALVNTVRFQVCS